ncbi:hypothetical protein DAT35_40015 [Vitiosangium sp. GDMCC 1.1324]|nr:hypothetical protein DAT35_40015 [Vitiosangium sp. GDMCC 1.1324]
MASLHEPEVNASDADAGTPDGGTPADERSAYCARPGPPWLVVDGATGQESCSGHLAARTFPHALCSCEGLEASAPFGTDAFRSSQGSWSPGAPGASIATNGGLSVNSPMEVGGSLWVASTGIQLTSTLSIAESLRNGGPLMGRASVSVRGNAQVSGDISLDALTVGGILSLPAERDLTVSGSLQVSELRREPVEPPVPPCPCAATERVDIGAYVANHVTANHDASIGLEPTALDGFSGDRTLELPCGRFYLSRISGPGSVRLVVSGRAALFVGGDVAVGQRFDVELLEGAELDLFIAGKLSAVERLSLGSVRYPARLRVYVGGTDPIEVPTASTLAGNFYAPLAYMALSERVELYGSLFIQRLAASGGLSVHYDMDVLGTEAACSDVSSR